MPSRTLMAVAHGQRRSGKEGRCSEDRGDRVKAEVLPVAHSATLEIS
jgi:hypothetical protein